MLKTLYNQRVRSSNVLQTRAYTGNVDECSETMNDETGDGIGGIALVEADVLKGGGL